MSAGEESTVVLKYGLPGNLPRKTFSIPLCYLIHGNASRRNAITRASEPPLGLRTSHTELAGKSIIDVEPIPFRQWSHDIRFAPLGHMLFPGLTPGKRMSHMFCRSTRSNGAAPRCGCEIMSSKHVFQRG